jgi:hypothetical protein
VSVPLIPFLLPTVYGGIFGDFSLGFDHAPSLDPWSCCARRGERCQTEVNSRDKDGGSIGELGLYHGTPAGEPVSSAAGSGQGAWLAWRRPVARGCYPGRMDLMAGTGAISLDLPVMNQLVLIFFLLT